MNYRVVALLLTFVSLLPVAGCDKVDPVAPTGTTLTISANPAKIQSATGTSTITVVARRANGQPIIPGTQIRFSTDLGVIDAVAETDNSGVATATLRGTGRVGTAKVTATTANVAEGPTVEVEIGTSAKTIVLQPTPTTLPSTGGKVTLLAVVRDSTGQPLANQGVNFTTDLGTLNSRGATVTTNARGEARDTLTLSEQDLSNNASSVTVSVQTAGSDGGAVTQTATIHVQGDRPVASFTYQQGNTPQEVLFIDTSTSQGALTYSWNFGDGSSSTESNPTHLYAAPGTYTVVLTVTDVSGLSDTATARVTVPVTSPGNGS
jgi:hypothetical protein